MATFGANLKREREMRGVPLEEIADATKIGIRSLQALEAEEFSKLPGGIFTRSFIRAYAKYLGLDEETVMGEYHAFAPPKEEADLSRMSATHSKPFGKSSRSPLLGLLIAVILLGGGYALFRYSHRTTESEGIVQSSTRIAAATPPVSVPPVQSTTQTTGNLAPSTIPAGGPDAHSSANPNTKDESKTPPVANPPPTGAKSAESDSNLTLQVAATERVWVAVEADGKTVLQRILKPNDIQTFNAKDSFDIIAGSAKGIILTLNGETMKPLSESKKVHLTHDDLKNLAP